MSAHNITAFRRRTLVRSLVWGSTTVAACVWMIVSIVNW